MLRAKKDDSAWLKVFLFKFSYELLLNYNIFFLLNYHHYITILKIFFEGIDRNLFQKYI